MCVVTLVSSQERRALAVSLINRLSTADEPVVNRGFCSPIGFKHELDGSCFRRDVQDSCLRPHGVHEGQMSPGRTGPSTSLPARPCAAPPRPAPTRPWYVRVLDSASSCFRRVIQDSGYGRCWGCRCSWTCCGGCRIGISRVHSFDPPWMVPPRVGTAWQRKTCIFSPGNCLRLSLGQKQMIVLRRSKVQRLQVVRGHRQTNVRLFFLRYKLEHDVGHKTIPSYGITL